jgi:hypothetical protein
VAARLNKNITLKAIPDNMSAITTHTAQPM